MRGPGYAILPRPVTGRAISVEIFARLTRPQAVIYVVSPFLEDYDFLGTPLSSILLNHLAGGAKVTLLTTPPPGKDPERAVAKSKYQLLRRLNEEGVRVLVNQKLHAKIYMFEESVVTRSLVLGSANLTRSGMEQWLEIALISYNHELYQRVYGIVIGFEHDRSTMPLLRWAAGAGVP